MAERTGIITLNSADEVVFVLHLALVLGPLAVYFLGLGLVNSQARPCLVNARTDFVLLAIAVIPVVICPLVVIVELGRQWLAVGVVIVVGGLFYWMLPSRDAGWVIYNIDPQRCRHLLKHVCRQLGWDVEEDSAALRIEPVGLIVNMSILPWLRNVTLSVCKKTGGKGGSAHVDLIRGFHREIQTESMLPSPAGASLVIVGGALLGLPMWYLFHHMDAVVVVVRRILLA
ncbi:MAG: hypothetical protein JSV03_09265 [Planctomycetota bacterium]|nr:MAG: hypothetical protein JSV03_09265 [Planctomycetota bacterium]